MNGERGDRSQRGVHGARIVRRLPFTVHRLPFTIFIQLLTLAALLACGGLSPLRGHAVIGRDAYLIFVGEAPGGQSDLFGVRADGGPVFQITYTPVAEAAPALSPDGGAVAFLRGSTTADTRPGRIWVLNLLSGAEREIRMPLGAGQPSALGWSEDGAAIYVRTDSMLYRLVAPPGSGQPRIVTGADQARAESSLAVLVGQPPFGSVVACGSDLCAQNGHDSAAPFAPHAHDPVRWGPDSVGYLSGSELIVRPVGPGHSRRVEWSGAPAAVRELTFFPGKTVNGER